MALPDRLTTSQLMTSLDKLGVKAPAAVTAAYERTIRVSRGAQNLGPHPDDLYVAIAAALAADQNPSADPDVQRVLTASQIANGGIMQGVDAIVFDQFRAVCTEHADAIIKALAKPFDAAVKTLDTAHKAIGNTPLENWVFRHECGSPNGFELGFLLLRQRFWAGAAGLWFVPVLRRFFNGSRQFG